MSLRSLVRRLLFAEMKKTVVLARHKVLQAEDMPALPAHLQPRQLPFSEHELDTASARRLIWSLFRRGKKYVVPALLCNAAYVLLNLAKPVLVNSFIHRISGELSQKSDFYLALLLAVALGSVSFVGSLAIQHYFLRMLAAFQIFTNAVNRLVFQHSLALTQKSRAASQLGDVVNHMGSDSDAISDVGMMVGDLMISVLSILGAAVLLFYYLGLTAFLSLALLLLLVPLTRQVARAFSRFDEELMKQRDTRVTLMSQVLNGIRVVKYFSWEKSVSKEIGAVRAQELQARKRLARAEALATLSYVSISTLVLFASLALHVHRGFLLTPELAFTCVAIFALLEEPLSHLSEVVSRLAAAFVSAERICGFLKREVLEISATEETQSSVCPAVRLENLSVQHAGSAEVNLRSIDLEIQAGESVAIVGPVGSGKSTLLHALLRELPFQAGALSYLDTRGQPIRPRIAYVPQEAFITNGSLKENLLFGGQENATLLETALHVSCLRSDLPQLPAGLFTEIGESGVNLSGGQKQRVSLARAVLHEPKLVLLDDPLSAVDARTEEQLVDRLLFGHWQGITRVVATHRLAFLSRFDKVVFLVDGKILAQGSLDALTTHCVEFRHFFADSARAEHGSALLATEAAHAPTAASVLQPEVRQTEDEDRATGAVKQTVYLDYLRALGGLTKRSRLWLLPLLLLSSIAAAALPLLQRAWLAMTANAQSGGQNSPASGLQSLAQDSSTAIYLYGALGLLTLLGILVNRLFWLERGMAAGRNMHDRMLHSVLKAPLRFFDSTPIGRILQRFSRDVEAVDIQLQWSFETTVRALVNITTALFLILSVLPLMLLVVAPVLWLYYRIQRDYRIPAREAKRLDAISRSPRFAHFKETLQGLVVIRSFGKTNVFREQFFDRLEHSQRMFFGHYMLNRWFSSRIPLLGGLVASGTAIGIVFYSRAGLLSGGVAGLVMIYALSLWESLNWAVRIFAEMESRMTSVERLKYYAAIPPERDVGNPPGLDPNWPSKGELVFDHVVARYAEHLPPVLKGVSFRIPAGARVGIIGRTGSGKSTLLQALFRSMELESGAIRLDGVDVAGVPLERLRRSLAIIPQDPTLFMGKLRDNLDRYQEYSDAEVWTALRQARLEALVRALPGHLLAPVTENGANFSQGQRQLLCLARALLVEAKVVVMDEATASVDVQTDSLLQEVLREACKGVTMLIIAHRLGTVADCDFILEIKEGKLHRSLDLKKERHPLAPI